MTTFTAKAPSVFGTPATQVVSTQIVGSPLAKAAGEFIAREAILSKQAQVDFGTAGRADVLGSLMRPATGATAILVRRASPLPTATLQ